MLVSKISCQSLNSLRAVLAGQNSVFATGSPSVLGLDRGGRRLAVPSGLFQKLPHALRPKTGHCKLAIPNTTGSRLGLWKMCLSDV